MFDIGFSELVVCGIVALVVIGPERLPRVARTVGTLRVVTSFSAWLFAVATNLVRDEARRDSRRRRHLALSTVTALPNRIRDVRAAAAPRMTGGAES